MLVNEPGEVVAEADADVADAVATGVAEGAVEVANLLLPDMIEPAGAPV